MTDRNQNIDLLKCVAILFIMTTHFTFSDAERIEFFFPFWIDMGVPIFLIITGINNYNSFEKKPQKIGIWFSKGVFLPKIKRLSVPFAIMIILELFAEIVIKDASLRTTAAAMLIESGYGAGGYYFYIMLQIMIIFPFMYFPFKKHPVATVVTVGLINIIFEMIVNVTDMDSAVYRILAFRYLLFVAVGLLIAGYIERFKALHMITFLMIGIGYIYYNSYSGLPDFLFTQWTKTSCPVALYTAFFIYIALKYIPEFTRGRRIVQIISRSTYHIFIVQMFYDYSLYKIINGNYGVNVLTYCFSITLCVLLGVGFCTAEQKILRRIKQRKLSKDQRKVFYKNARVDSQEQLERQPEVPV